MITRSRRASRSATSDRMHSVEHIFSAAQRRDNLEDVEHKRVIDSFVVRENSYRTFENSTCFFVGLSCSSEHATQSIDSS